MQVTIIPIVIGAFGNVTKWLLKGLEDLEVGGRVETIQTTTLLRTVRILRKVLETWGDCCHSNSSERPSDVADVKNSKGVNNNNNKPLQSYYIIDQPCIHSLNKSRLESVFQSNDNLLKIVKSGVDKRVVHHTIINEELSHFYICMN